MSWAAVGFCAVARIALPSGVNFTNKVSAIIVGTVTPTTIASFHVRVRSVLGRRLVSDTRSGNLTGVAPFQNSPRFMKMKLTPIAETITVSLGELRRGL